MTYELDHLYGRSLASFARDVAGCRGWDTIDIDANGSITLYDQWRHALRFWGRGCPSDPPDEPPPPALVDAIAAVRAGKVCLLADGDRTLGFAEVVIPPGLLRGRWRVRVTRDGEEWVRSIDPSGRLVVEPTYARPRFAAMKTPAVAKGTGTAGRPSSWYLIETECRRRYSEGERHPGLGGESSKAWASVLVAWLRDAHPEAPPMTEKTAQNRLIQLLRDLKTGIPK